MKLKSVAFIFALPVRTNPILITMPFGLNVITLLSKKGYQIDVYLTEYTNQSYDIIYSENVTIKFIDQNYLWRNKVSLAFSLVTNYFKCLSFFKLRNKYDFIFSCGMTGITLGQILKKYNKNSKLIYLNDEFPDATTDKKLEIWKNAEKHNGSKANIVCTPDESRYEPLCRQIPKLNKIPHYTLPNAPLIDEIKNTPEINWHKYFELSPDKKIFLSAGGIGDLYFLPELLNSLENWPDDAILILKGKNNINSIKNKYSHLPIKDKVIWCSDNFLPDELHSLIKYSTASICLYKNENDNIYYMGKSSGKLMRSIALGKPVITSNFSSLNFVEELEIGKQAGKETEIVKAVNYIIKNGNQLQTNCIQKYSSISFEKYWSKLEESIGF